MTDIIFINPPSNPEEKYGPLAAVGSAEPPLGLCYLAAFVRKAGYSVEILDAEALHLDYAAVVTEILEKKPKHIGLTSTTMTFNHAAEIAKRVKKTRPEITTIIGGVHLTALPQKTLEQFPQFDVGVVGEGEITAVELLKSLEEKKDLSSIKGLVIREGSTVKITEARPYIENLDELPFPAWDLLPDLRKNYRPQPFSFKKLPSTSIITSRGCGKKCTFCDRSVFGNRPRAHSAQYVVNMMKHLTKTYGIKDFSIEDDNFIVFRSRLNEICDLMKKEGLDVSWSCLGRVDQVTKEVLENMSNVGCWCIGYGIETGSQHMLDLLKKRITLEQIRTALTLTKNVGITTKGYFIFGLPLETKETLQKTIDFAKEIDLDLMSISYLTPLPGTEIINTVDEYGSYENTWEKMSEFHPIFIPNGLTEKDLLEYRTKAVREFYVRPKIIVPYLINGFRNPWNFVKLLKGANVVIRLH